MNVGYYGLVEYTNYQNREQYIVVCAFQTRQHGYVQVGKNDDKVIEYDSQPSLYNFTEDERDYIEEILTIVHRLVFDAPKPETLK